MSGVELPPRVARIESVNEVNINAIAEIVVAFESTVADPRVRNTVCDPMPPNAPARSAETALPPGSTYDQQDQGKYNDMNNGDKNDHTATRRTPQ